MKSLNKKTLRRSGNPVPSSGRSCDCPGCEADGDYRAPRSRDNLGEYYWFCLEHVKAYNARWDYCKNMTAEDIEREIRRTVGGERPTWRLRDRVSSRHFRFDIGDHLGVFGEAAHQRDRASSPPPSRLSADETAAMTLMDLTPPLTMVALKSRYKLLVKRYHPDANGGDPGAEERIKQINAAYSLLRTSLKNAM